MFFFLRFSIFACGWLKSPLYFFVRVSHVKIVIFADHLVRAGSLPHAKTPFGPYIKSKRVNLSFHVTHDGQFCKNPFFTPVERKIIVSCLAMPREKQESSMYYTVFLSLFCGCNLVDLSPRSMYLCRICR